MAFMLNIKNIANKKMLTILVGLMIGLGIIAQPIVEVYVDCEETCCIEEKATETDDQDEKEAETQVTALQAVNSVAQIDLTPNEFVLEEISQDTNPERTVFSELVEKIPPKLLKVLFNRIISTNAP